MRHLKHRSPLGVKKAHRIALMANLGTALIRHGRIKTTLAKAKGLRPFIEKIITMAKEAQTAIPERSLYLRRLAISRLRSKEAVRILFNEKASEFLDRPGGYTRIYKLGNRMGDAAEMALIEMIDATDEGYTKGRKGKPGSSKAKKKAETTPTEPVEAEGVEAEGVEDSIPEAGETESKVEDKEEEPAVEKSEQPEPENAEKKPSGKKTK